MRPILISLSLVLVCAVAILFTLINAQNQTAIADELPAEDSSAAAETLREDNPNLFAQALIPKSSPMRMGFTPRNPV